MDTLTDQQQAVVNEHRFVLQKEIDDYNEHFRTAVKQWWNNVEEQDGLLIVSDSKKFPVVSFVKGTYNLATIMREAIVMSAKTVFFQIQYPRLDIEPLPPPFDNVFTDYEDGRGMGGYIYVDLREFLVHSLNDLPDFDMKPNFNTRVQI